MTNHTRSIVGIAATAVLVSLAVPASAYFGGLAPWASACAQSGGAAPGCGQIPVRRGPAIQQISPEEQQIEEQQRELDHMQQERDAAEQRAREAEADDRAGLDAQSRGDLQGAIDKFLAALDLAPGNAAIQKHLNRANIALAAMQSSAAIDALRQRIEAAMISSRIAALRQDLEAKILSRRLVAFYNSFLVARSPQCEKLDTQIGQMNEVARRANLALDSYSFFDDNEGRPRVTPWQAQWKAPQRYTLLSNNVLEMRKMLPGWDSAMIKKFLAPDDSQYRAAIYRDDASGTIFLTFRGTDENTNNWTGGNIPNELGLYTNYFGTAGGLAYALKHYTDLHGLQLECVGHSLGGGMCISAAIHAHIKATVFNAETVRSSGLADGDDIRVADGLVVDYVTAREIVSTSQAAFLVEAPGKHVPLPDWSGESMSPIVRHRMPFVRLSIQNQIQTLQKERTSRGCAP
jgi:tetratricopeptide (TPR) repeat protein